MKKSILIFMCFIISCSGETGVNQYRQLKVNEDNPKFVGVTKTLDIEWRTVFNHSYNRIDILKMDVFEPSVQISNKPAIVFLGGGGSVEVHKQAQEDFRFFFARRGYWVTSIEVRVTHPDSSHRCMVDIGADFASAISWVRENSDSLGVNENRVFGVGSSMGASAAMTAAYVDTSFLLDEFVPFDWIPDAVASFSGTLDWNPVWPCSWLSEIESGEPFTKMWIGRKDPLWEIQRKTFLAANAVGVASGQLVNRGHGIPGMGEIWSAEQALKFLQMFAPETGINQIEDKRVF